MRGLTKPTSIAWCQTVSATIDCARFLLSECGFYYVLLGQLQSDPIERRFGLFRQSHGGNYYISVRQVFETERKLRAMNLTKCFTVDVKECSSISLPDLSPLSMSFYEQLGECREPDDADLNAIYYVAGALCKMELRNRQCDSCQTILTSVGSVSAHSTVNESVGVFVRSLNRSGLLNHQK